MERIFTCTGIHALAYHEFEPLPLKPNQVRIKAEFGAAKHGTEMSFYHGYAIQRGAYDNQMGVFMRDTPANRYPFHVGNMVVGHVIETGQNVTRLKKGDRVLAYSGFATSTVVDNASCWILPDDTPWQSAVCIDPADFAFSAIRDGNVRIGDGVAVFSLGAIGLMAVQLLQLAGAYPIIAVDPIAQRRDLASQFGASHTLDPLTCDAGVEIRKATQGRGADVVIEYSGTRQAMQDALRGVAFGGTVVAGAFPPPYAAGLDLGAESHMNRPNLIFTRACSDPNRDYPRWDNDRIYACCYRLILQGKIQGEKVVSPVVGFDELLSAYPRIADDPASTLKLGVRY